MSVIPEILSDPIPGNIGLRRDELSNIVLRLGEPTGVLPADEVGNLDNLAADTGTTAPAQVATWTGYGRRFRQGASTALITSDLEAPGENLHSVLLRDVTVQAILALTLSGATGQQTVIARGANDGSTSERYCYGLELLETAPGSGLVTVRWFWQDEAGTIHTDAGGTFATPGDGQFFLLTATRRWQSTTSVVCRYYIGGVQIAEVASANGSISGGTTGHTTLGGRKSGGTWSNFLNADLDELVVSSVEISPEEIYETERRLAEHQMAGVDAFTGLAPPGAPWYRNPANAIGRLVKVAGQALGTAVAEAERLRALWLPDAAPIYKIADWEALCGLAPKPSDSLDTRRARVVAYLSRDNGFSIPEVQAALAESLDLAASDIPILEFSNTITDSFTALAPERWRVGSVGTWAIASNALSLTQASGADLRHTPTFADCHVRTPVADWHLSMQVKLDAWWTLLPVNTIVGLFLYSFLSKNALWFGVMNVAGVHQLGYVSYRDGVLGAFVPLANPIGDMPLWLRISNLDSPPGGFVIGDGGGAFNFEWSTTGPSSGFTVQGVSTGLLQDVEWGGMAAMSTDASLASDLAATFDDFFLRNENGTRPFNWYAYRDPGLSGSPDMTTANLIVKRIKPAHTYAAATESKSVLCDDPLYGLCDGGPMGAL